MSGRDGWISVANPPRWADGSRSERLTIHYRSWGRLNARRDNAVLVCPALTGDRRVERWWGGLLGPDKALDPDSDFILAVDVHGGCGGTTARPLPERVDVADMVQAQRLLLDQLEIDRLNLVIGGSLGGMQALEWAVGDPERLEAAVVIAAPACQTAWAAGLNHIQRRSIEQHGDLELARMVAMISYRHWQDTDGRLLPLDDQRGTIGDYKSADKTIGGWLNHHGNALRARFDQDAYLRLIAAMDRHDVGRDRGGWQTALEACPTPTLAVGIASDLLYPPEAIRSLAEALPCGQLAWLDAPQGHDAFLIEQATLNRQVLQFRRSLKHTALKEELSA